VTVEQRDWDDSYTGAEPPPWDIGRPQPRFAAIARTGGFHGRVLDSGCGTGEHALLAAEHGADVLGVDIAAHAIAEARRKADARGLPARFEVANALELADPVAPYDVVIDSGVFHVFDDADRLRYVDALRRQTAPGSVCYLMCFSDKQPGDWGPRRIRADELRAAFADGWDVGLEPATFDVLPVGDITEVQAWFATIRRVS
jgi:SAM-dependent methyltransferase